MQAILQLILQGTSLKPSVWRCLVEMHSKFVLGNTQNMILTTCSCFAAASLISENEDFCSTCLEGYTAGQSLSFPL